MADVIVNTSPLQYLHTIGEVDLLRKLFGTIIVPDAVVSELAEGRRLGLSLPDPSRGHWMEIAAPAMMRKWQGLGLGEAAGLALALERPGSSLIIDDRRARRAAEREGIPLVGTAGVLLRAKRAGHIAAVKPSLNQLVTAGFRIAPVTLRAILKLAGEAS